MIPDASEPQNMVLSCRMNSLSPSGLLGMVTVVSPPAQDLQPSEGDLSTSFSLQLSLKQCWIKTSPSTIYCSSTENEAILMEAENLRLVPFGRKSHEGPFHNNLMKPHSSYFIQMSFNRLVVSKSRCAIGAALGEQPRKSDRDFIYQITEDCTCRGAARPKPCLTPHPSSCQPPERDMREQKEGRASPRLVKSKVFLHMLA